MKTAYSKRFKKKSILAICLVVIIFSSVFVSAVSYEESDGGYDVDNDGDKLTETPQYPEKITVEVRTTIETGLGDTGVGDLDVFIHRVDKRFIYPIYEPPWNLGKWECRDSYNNFLFNPAYDKDTVEEYPDTDLTVHLEDPEADFEGAGGLPVIEVDGEWQFNPFADADIRRAVNHLIDRTYIVEEMYDDYGSERFMAMGQETAGYKEYYRDIVERLGVDDHDPELGTQMIQDRMEYWRDTEYIEDWTGELVTGNQDDGWHFGGDDIELELIIRVEDTRQSIGHYFGDLMEDQGFVANRYEQEAATAFQHTLFSNPADMLFHMYTGRWEHSAASKYKHETMNKMYTGWYGWSPGLQTPSWWQYEEPEEITELGKDLMEGRIQDEEAYWEAMQTLAEYGMRSGMRVFIVTPHEAYVYNPDKVFNAAPDVVTGYSSIYTPRTLKLEDDDHLRGALYSPFGALYIDNWNRIGGSGDRNSLYVQDMVRDHAMYNHPVKGTPIGIRADHEVHLDYEWVEEDEYTLEKNVTVPSHAVDYDTSTQEWYEVGEGMEAATSATFDWFENGEGGLGTFHDGNPLTYRDILAWYAFSKELSFDEGDGYYYGPWATVNEGWFDNVKGIELHTEDGNVTSYTIYGDYTFSSDDIVAEYYSQTPFKPWQVYEAARIMVAQLDEESDLWQGVDGAGETWSWSEAENWIHFISSTQGETFKAVMENMITEEWEPAYFDNMPEEVDGIDVASEIQRSIDFYDQYDHFFISQGPFKIIEIDEPNMVIEMERCCLEDGYPLARDYWEDILLIRQLELTDHTVPSSIDAGEEFNISATGRIQEDYPVRELYAADEGEVTFEIIVPDEEDRTFTMYEPVDGTFEDTISANFTEGLKGTYDWRLEGTIEDEVRPSLREGSITIHKAVFEITNFDVVPTEGNATLDVDITAYIENVGDAEGTIELVTDDVEINNWTLKPEEDVTIDETYTYAKEGIYHVELGDENITVEVGPIPTCRLTVETDGEGTVDIEPEKEEYEHGEEVTLTALPDEGHEFVGWDGTDETGEEITITMYDDKEVTAHFQINTYSVEIDIEGEGSVEIDPKQDEYEYGEEIELTPEPKEGYVFDHWVINGEIYEEETIEIEMYEDTEITAQFDEKEKDGEILNPLMIAAIVIAVAIIGAIVAVMMKKDGEESVEDEFDEEDLFEEELGEAKDSEYSEEDVNEEEL